MCVGLAFVFYIAHTRFWAVPVRDEKGNLVLWVGGTVNRNRDAFEQRFQDLTEKIKSELKEMKPAAASQAQVASLA